MASSSGLDVTPTDGRGIRRLGSEELEPQATNGGSSVLQALAEQVGWRAAVVD
jgi:hypothetical protein